MKQSIHYQTVSAPTAFVTKSKQRVKQYNNNVYLNSGDEFEIELFNPTQSKVLAKIKLNGTYISTSGIVLRPGERVYLERYLDNARKFLFDTYTVDGNDSNTKYAIEKNGLVEVEFYEEKKPTVWTASYTVTSTPYWGGTEITGPKYRGPYYYAGDVVYSTYTSHGACNIGNQKNTMIFSNQVLANKEIETGRVEQGAHSEQRFDSDSTEFNSYYSWKTEWKILPQSQKYVESSDLTVYCTNCGAKRKKTSHKFCPHCGTKF
jgi:hypothetical protein